MGRELLSGPTSGELRVSERVLATRGERARARVAHLSALIQRAWAAAVTDFDLGTAACMRCSLCGVLVLCSSSLPPIYVESLSCQRQHHFRQWLSMAQCALVPTDEGPRRLADGAV
jgi:hypothetical protein